MCATKVLRPLCFSLKEVLYVLLKSIYFWIAGEKLTECYVTFFSKENTVVSVIKYLIMFNKEGFQCLSCPLYLYSMSNKDHSFNLMKENLFI